MTRERFVCECGQPLRRPLPVQCPRCQATLTGVRRSVWNRFYPLLLVAGMFLVLILYVLWLLK